MRAHARKSSVQLVSEQ